MWFLQPTWDVFTIIAISLPSSLWVFDSLDAHLGDLGLGISNAWLEIWQQNPYVNVLKIVPYVAVSNKVLV